ncbi:MAG: hypothetical protein ACRCVT_07325 [Leadbetterella sp.]
MRKLIRIIPIYSYGLIAIALWGSLTCRAQFYDDAVLLPKNSVFVNSSAGLESYSQWWENTNLVSPTQFSKFTAQKIQVDLAFSPSSRICVGMSLPWISTQTTGGVLMGQKGVQDISGFIKFNVLNPELPIATIIQIQGSRPMGSYTADLLPMAIGKGNNTLSGGLIVRYLSKLGFYASIHGNYVTQSNVLLNRNQYLFNDELVFSDEVQIPNQYNTGIRLGYMKSKVQIDLIAQQRTSTSGDNMTQGQIPFFSNKITQTHVGFYGKYVFRKIGINARINQVLAGKNTEKRLTLMAGLLFQMGGNNVNNKRFEY